MAYHLSVGRSEITPEPAAMRESRRSAGSHGEGARGDAAPLVSLRASTYENTLIVTLRLHQFKVREKVSPGRNSSSYETRETNKYKYAASRNNVSRFQ